MTTERSALEQAAYIAWENRSLGGWQPTGFTDAAELTRCIQNGNVAGGWPFVITGPPLCLEIGAAEPAVSPTANSYSDLDRLREENARLRELMLSSNAWSVHGSGCAELYKPDLYFCDCRQGELRELLRAQEASDEAN